MRSAPAWVVRQYAPRLATVVHEETIAFLAMFVLVSSWTTVASLGAYCLTTHAGAERTADPRGDRNQGDPFPSR